MLLPEPPCPISLLDHCVSLPSQVAHRLQEEEVQYRYLAIRLVLIVPMQKNGQFCLNSALCGTSLAVAEHFFILLPIPPLCL